MAPPRLKVTSAIPPSQIFKLCLILMHCFRPTGALSIEQCQPSRRECLIAGAVLCQPIRSSYALTSKVDDARSLSTSEFYAQYPYRNAEDALPYLRAVATRGDATSVLSALDLWSERYPMFQVGPVKGKILEDAVISSRPMLAVELGSFLGYSAVRVARALPKDGRLICVEASPEFADVAKNIIAYAGFADRVNFIVSRASDCLDALRDILGQSKTIDLLFLDHAKERYAPDLELLEQAGFIRPGTLVVADNVLYPGAPGYLEHVESPLYSTRLIPAPYESRGWETNWKAVDDAISLSTRL